MYIWFVFGKGAERIFSWYQIAIKENIFYNFISCDERKELLWIFGIVYYGRTVVIALWTLRNHNLSLQDVIVSCSSKGLVILGLGMVGVLNAKPIGIIDLCGAILFNIGIAVKVYFELAEREPQQDLKAKTISSYGELVAFTGWTLVANSKLLMFPIIITCIYTTLSIEDYLHAKFATKYDLLEEGLVSLWERVELQEDKKEK